MIQKILKIGVLCSLSLGYFALKDYQIELKNPIIQQIFSVAQAKVQFKDIKKPELVLPMLRYLISMNILKKEQKFQKYILAQGFDFDGQLIQQIKSLGFRGMEIGSTSFKPTEPQDPYFSLGIMNALSKIISFQQKQNDNSFVISLHLIPNYEILKYTPYLIEQNLLGAFQEFQKINKMLALKSIEYLCINLNHKNISQFISSSNEQIDSMIIKTMKESNQILKRINQGKQKSKFIKLRISLNSTFSNLFTLLQKQKLCDEVMMDSKYYTYIEKPIEGKKNVKKQSKIVLKQEIDQKFILSWSEVADFILNKKQL